MLDSDTMTLDQAIQILEDEDETDPEFFEACRFALRVLIALQDLCGVNGNTGAANGDHGIIKSKARKNSGAETVRGAPDTRYGEENDSLYLHMRVYLGDRPRSIQDYRADTGRRDV